MGVERLSLSPGHRYASNDPYTPKHVRGSCGICDPIWAQEFPEGGVIRKNVNTTSNSNAPSVTSQNLEAANTSIDLVEDLTFNVGCAVTMLLEIKKSKNTEDTLRMLEQASWHIRRENDRLRRPPSPNPDLVKEYNRILAGVPWSGRNAR